MHRSRAFINFDVQPVSCNGAASRVYMDASQIDPVYAAHEFVEHLGDNVFWGAVYEDPITLRPVVYFPFPTAPNPRAIAEEIPWVKQQLEDAVRTLFPERDIRVARTLIAESKSGLDDAVENFIALLACQR